MARDVLTDPSEPENAGAASGPNVISRRRNTLGFAYFAVFVLLVGFVVVVTLTGSARDGDPVVSLTIAPFSEAGNDGIKVPVAPQSVREVGGNLVADPALLEETASGLLPKIGADGRAPREAYAGASDANDTRPWIAIVIHDLGTGFGGTSIALSNLPPGVTLAFVPYAQDLQTWIDKARGSGHEVLVEAPMEPLDFPDSDPGPRALLVNASDEENGKRLNWVLSRSTGYVGLTNLMGTRLLGEAKALDPVFATLSQRGLLFFDDGSSPRSVSALAAKRHGVPLAIGSLTIDVVQAAQPIDEQLADLEQRARESGAAVGTGSPYPVTIDRIATWAKSLESRGFVLVPVSRVARKPVGSP